MGIKGTKCNFNCVFVTHVYNTYIHMNGMCSSRFCFVQFFTLQCNMARKLSTKYIAFIFHQLGKGLLHGDRLDNRRHSRTLPSFNSVSFKSIPKSCNRVALALTNFSKEKNEQSVWLEDCPSFLFPIVTAEFPVSL